MKALVAEMVGNFSKRLEPYKIQVGVWGGQTGWRVQAWVWVLALMGSIAERLGPYTTQACTTLVHASYLPHRWSVEHQVPQGLQPGCVWPDGIHATERSPANAVLTPTVPPTHP